MTRRSPYDPSRDKIPDACDDGLPDVETCTLDFSGIDDEDTISKSTTYARDSYGKKSLLDSDVVLSEAYSRGKWLLGLLILQSASSIVLDRYGKLLQEHLVVTLFLTMLVGAGGNAGNQSAIKIIRGLATGRVDNSLKSMQASVFQQAKVGLVLGTALSFGGFLRVYLSDGSVINAMAISASLMAIVLTSVILGSALPFGLSRIGIDPANAGTSIQVIMDIFGVGITCLTCDFVFRQFLSSL